MSEKTVSEEAYMMACNAVGAKQYEIEVRDERIQELEAALEQERANNAVLREALESYAREDNPDGGYDCDICLGWGEWPDEIKHKPDCILSDNPGAGVMEVVRAAERDLSDAKHNCGGDGQGCDMFRRYYKPPVVWKKCGHCPMDVMFDTNKALNALNGGRDAE